MAGRRRHVLTARGNAFLGAGAAFLAGGLLLGFSDLTRIGALLVVLPAITWLLARRRPPRLAVRRTVHPSRMRMGERALVQIDFANVGARRTPILLAEESLDYALGDRPRFVLAAMGVGERRRVRYTVNAQVRGQHTLGPIALRLRDPFGLTSVNLALRATTDVLVLPRVEDLGYARPRGEGVGNEGEIPHMVALHGEDDVSIRTYRDGDDLRRIHWAATAHRGELMVRQEDRPARRRAVVFLDSRASAHRGAGPHSSFETAVSAAASVAVRLADLTYATHLVCDDASALWPVEGNGGLDNTMALLAVAQLGQDVGFEEAIRTAHPQTAAGGLLVAVVADHDEEAVRRLAALRNPGSVALAFVLDTDSFAQPAAALGAQPAPAPPTDPARPPNPSVAMVIEVLRAAGWTTAPLRSGESIRQAWSSLTARPLERVGS